MHKDDAAIIATTHNTARYFTEQRHVAWVALIGTVLWGIFTYPMIPQRMVPTSATQATWRCSVK